MTHRHYKEKLNVTVATVGIEIVEQGRGPFNPLCIGLLCSNNSVKKSLDSCGFFQPKRIIVHVNIVNDLRYTPKGFVIFSKYLRKHLKGALFIYMGKLSFHHVKSQFIFLRLIAIARHKFKGCLFIDETADEPGAGHSVHIDVCPCDPGFSF